MYDDKISYPVSNNTWQAYSTMIISASSLYLSVTTKPRESTKWPIWVRISIAIT